MSLSLSLLASMKKKEEKRNLKWNKFQVQVFRSKKCFLFVHHFLIIYIYSLYHTHILICIPSSYICVGDDGVPMVLVGNKADLLEDRKVTLELIAQNKLQFMNDCPYIETSAMFNRNIVTLFLELFKVRGHIYCTYILIDMYIVNHTSFYKG